jgi:hypothetical protein
VAALTAPPRPPGPDAPGTTGTTETPETPERDGADGAGPLLSAADATLVRDFLVRRERLDPAARTRLAERLADTLAARYGLQARRAGASTEVFLERLAGR